MNYYSRNTIGNAVSYSSQNVRTSYIRQVYGIFFSSLIFTVLAGFFAEPFAGIIARNFMFLFIIEIVFAFALAFTRRTTGLNLMMLYAFAALQGVILCPMLLMAGAVSPGIPLMAAVLTLSIFGGLSLYTLISGKDFSYLGGFLSASLIGLIIGGIVMMFLHLPMMSLVYSFIGILIFSGYVLYDTSNILNRHLASEPITGAIALYLDLLNLFYLVLDLLMSLNRRN